MGEGGERRVHKVIIATCYGNPYEQANTKAPTVGVQCPYSFKLCSLRAGESSQKPPDSREQIDLGESRKQIPYNRKQTHPTTECGATNRL
jgi:hypothetical protein